ncbi:hypothetical protein M0R45_005128 [Rubus argutus]|uniref:Uncharacterized protein n=1 Tax=Rubus argutus TaxID=59490 RepID=A0AAW1YLR5_RUBAR
MSVLTVERQPWQGANQFGIPYPSYFHPSTWQEMLTWQRKVAKPTGPTCSPSSADQEGVGEGGHTERVHKAMRRVDSVLPHEMRLQRLPATYTRRSTFDSVLAGCIPCSFRRTRRTRSTSGFYRRISTFSVYIDEKSDASKRIEDELLKIPKEKVEMMREKVIEMIPSLTYAHPNASGIGFRDAVDVALASLANHVTN